MSCFGNAIVTTGRATVASGNENGDALSDGLLISGIVGGVGGCAVHGFALAITNAHDRGRCCAGVDEVLDGNQAAERDGCVGTSGHFNGSAGSGCTGPFGVEDSFGVVGSKSARGTAVIGAGGRRRVNLSKGGGSVAGQTKCRTENGPVRRTENVGVFNQYDCLALAGSARAEERIQIVNLGQVRGHNGIGVAARRIRKRELRPELMHLVHGRGPKIMQRDNAGNDGSECGGNSRIADIANVFLAFDLEIVNFRLETFADLRGGAGKIDEHPTGIDHVDAKTMRLQPSGNLVEVRLRQTEAFAKFLRGQPVMEVWRTFGVEFIDELLKGFFLFRRTLQLKEHVLHWEIFRHNAAIVREPGFGMGIARERDTIHFIDALRDPRASTQT